jgi:hypothetical protein
MAEDQGRSDEMKQASEAIASGQAAVCYAKCWPCQTWPRQCFDPPKAHTWMDREDAEHAGVAWPVDPSEPGRLCGCACAVVPGG